MKKTMIGLLLLSACMAKMDETPVREIIVSENAPAAIGPYSQAVRVGNMLFVAGQIAIEPESGKMVEGGIKQQTDRALQNVQAILTTAGFTFSDVVQSQVFLSDLENYKAMNEVYGTFFKDKPPARAAMQVARLPLDALVEIMVTAVKTRE